MHVTSMEAFDPKRISLWEKICETFSQLIFYVSKIEYNLPSADEDHFPCLKINVDKTENYSVTLWLARYLEFLSFVINAYFLGKTSKKLISKISKGQKHKLGVVLERKNN